MWRLILALALSAVVAGTTASIAWLLDPAVKKILSKMTELLHL